MSKSRIKSWLIAMVALFTCVLVGVPTPLAPAQAEDEVEPQYITICTFNVYKFGSISPKYTSFNDDSAEVPAGIPERVTNIARVLSVRPFDLIVLQEVTSGDQGKAAVGDLVSELNRIQERKFSFFLSDYIGQGLMPEAIAFIYDEALVRPELLTGKTRLVEYIEIPGRDMVRTQWEAGDFDFTLISAHLAWGNAADRVAGYKKIDEILHAGVPNDYSTDPDIIILGDFNRFGDGQEGVKSLRYDRDVWRVPNIEVFDPLFSEAKTVTGARLEANGVTGVDEQHLSTTVSSNLFVYDMIMFSRDADEEYAATTTTGTVGVDFGVICFDEKTGEGYQPGADTLSHDALKEAYSDHRPLWMRFRANAGHADDGAGGVALSPPPAEALYVGTEAGSKFHRPSCWTIRSSTITQRWEDRNKAAAARGPCGVCKP